MEWALRGAFGASAALTANEGANLHFRLWPYALAGAEPFEQTTVLHRRESEAVFRHPSLFGKEGVNLM
jgi:hypothetical protein